MPLLSPGPPTSAVLPSADSATDWPWLAAPVPAAPVPTSSAPCWLHTPPLRVNTHAAPVLPAFPPTIAVLPSADSATERPWLAPPPAASVPTSFGPCWLHTSPLRVNTHDAPVPPLSVRPPTIAVLPSAD